MEVALQNDLVTKDVGMNIEKKQKSFLNSSLWKVINTGLNTGIRALLPNLIEDQVIEIKDALIKNGFRAGTKQAVSSAIDLGKSAKGIVTGDFEDISQAYDAIKTGGILDTVSEALDFAIDKGISSKFIPKETGKVLKAGSDVIINSIESNIETNYTKQLKAVSLLGKYEENWNGYLKNQDSAGMEREYKKINTTLNTILPTRNTILEGERIKNVHKLLRSKNFDFDSVSKEEMDLAKSLVY